MTAHADSQLSSGAELSGIANDPAGRGVVRAEGREQAELIHPSGLHDLARAGMGSHPAQSADALGVEGDNWRDRLCDRTGDRLGSSSYDMAASADPNLS